jgi:8-oxo-dGTP pyrophosphatase MutT (NUDIX family)
MPSVKKPHDADVNGAFILCLRDSLVLTGRQTYGNCKRTIPGGGVHLNEPPDIAALRETHEETGLFLLASKLRLVGVMSQRLMARPDTTGLVTIFEADVSDETPRTADGELTDFEWLSIDDALRRREEFQPPMLRVMWHAHLCRHATGGRRFFSGHMSEPVNALLDGAVIAI